MSRISDWLWGCRWPEYAKVNKDLQQLKNQMTEVTELVAQIKANMDRLENSGKGIRIDVDKMKADIEILKGQTLDEEGLQALRDLAAQTASVAAVFEGIDAETPGEIVDPPVDPEEPVEPPVDPPVERNRSVRDWT